MKYLALVFGLMISSLSFASTINGITFSNLPTASKTYSLKTMDVNEIYSLTEKISEQCVNDLKEALAVVSKMNAKVISSTGCKDVKITAPQFTQGGVVAGEVSTSFEVIFK